MAQRTAFSTFASVVLLVAAASAARAQIGIGQDARPSPVPKVSRVVGTLEADSLIEVYLDHLNERASDTHNASKLIPYINGLELRGNYATEVHLDGHEDHLHFHLRITPENKDTWVNLLGAANGLRVQVTFRVGPEKQSPFDTVFDNGTPSSWFWWIGSTAWSRWLLSFVCLSSLSVWPEPRISCSRSNPAERDSPDQWRSCVLISNFAGHFR
jgi:hypothetical protein